MPGRPNPEAGPDSVPDEPGATRSPGDSPSHRKEENPPKTRRPAESPLRWSCSSRAPPPSEAPRLREPTGLRESPRDDPGPGVSGDSRSCWIWLDLGLSTYGAIL